MAIFNSYVKLPEGIYIYTHWNLMEFEGQNLVGLVIFMILMIPKLVDIRFMNKHFFDGGHHLELFVEWSLPSGTVSHG